jgi:hypothetical protein
MTQRPAADPREEARRREAQEALARVQADSDTLGGSAMARAAQRAADHFSGRDAIGPDGEADPAELWGRRIGRGLSVAAFVGLLAYLYFTYLV